MKSPFGDRKLDPGRVNRRTLVVYAASAFILLIVVLSFYFFMRKPEPATSNRPEEIQKVMMFRDVKYSGERKGLVDWEVRAKLVRQYLDKAQKVEMEGVEGDYKPKAGTVVSFKGSKAEMEMEKESGSPASGAMENVEVYYKGEYVVKSRVMNFDFKKSLAYTDAPVDLEGKRLSMMGIGLNADTEAQIVSLKRDVQGTMRTGKDKIRFSSNEFSYFMKDGRFVFTGKVVMKSEQMNLLCDKVSILSDGEKIEKAEATGNVRILASGAIAKSERAVYYLKDDRVVLENEPYVVKDDVEMRGETIIYNLKSDKFFVKKPKMRIEQRKQ